MVIPQIFGFVALAALAATVFGENNPEMDLLKEASKGGNVPKHKLSKAYWKLYDATYRRKSEWILLNHQEKSDVFKAREDLKDLFDTLPEADQNYIMKTRPVSPK